MFFSNDKYSTHTINDKSVDGVLGTRTQGSNMVGTDKSTELWWNPCNPYYIGPLAVLVAHRILTSEGEVSLYSLVTSFLTSFNSAVLLKLVTDLFDWLNPNQFYWFAFSSFVLLNYQKIYMLG